MKTYTVNVLEFKLSKDSPTTTYATAEAVKFAPVAPFIILDDTAGSVLLAANGAKVVAEETPAEWVEDVIPTGDVSVRTINAPTAAGQTITVSNQLDVIKLTGLTANTTLNFVAGSLLENGAKVVLDVVQGATGRNIIFGTGAKGPTLTGVNLDRDTIELVYDGTEFIATSNWTKIVDAA